MTDLLDDLATQAEQLLSRGRVAEAEGLCHALLRAVPEHPTALMILSVVRMASGRLAEAEVLLTRGCTAHPYVVGFHAALGRLRLQGGQRARAVESFENCVLLDPGNRDHRVMLVAVYQTRVFGSFSEASKSAMLACLVDLTLTHSSMHRAWLSLLRLDPQSASLFEIFDGAADYPGFTAKLESVPDFLRSVGENHLLMRGLERFLAADVAIERGLTFIRRWLFEHRHARPAGALAPGAARILDGFLPLLCALSRYCFLTEYVFALSEDHAVLRDELDAPAAVALLGCYEPLCGASGDGDADGEGDRPRWSDSSRPSRLSQLAQLSDEPCYRELVRSLIDEPLEERALRSTIATTFPIADEVSQAVQRQYEENPYPRWTTVGSDVSERDAGLQGGEGDGDGEGGGRARARGRGKRILIAGCGTGRDAVDAALNFGGAQVDAIDLSRSSLAYGARKARERGLENLSFAEGDLLDLPRWPTRYDLIMAAGVLHHMREPTEGLRALLGVLAPRGVLRIALYSRLARTAVEEARAWIKAAGFPSTASGIRDFRAAVISRPGDDPLRAWLTRSYDFYSLSQCRDLVFHVQEQTFTLPQIAIMIRAFGLKVLRLDLQSPVHLDAYRARFPGDPTATDLGNWHQLEQTNPSLFAGMYSLWLGRAGKQEAEDPSGDLPSGDLAWIEWGDEALG